jgi:hypothetical protein
MAETICQLKVVLKETQPLIWRRFQVRSDITFRELHKDTRPDESGSPSPIVQIQERHVPGLKSHDEHFIIHHTATPPRI